MQPLPVCVAFLLEFVDDVEGKISLKADARHCRRHQLSDDTLYFDFILNDTVGRNLFMSLCGISRVRQKNKLLWSDDQNTIAAAESTQVANVFRLAEDQGIQIKLRQEIDNLLPAL